MEILEPHDPYGWVTAIICDRWVQAKVYDVGSVFGINNGRVSKLVIGKTQYRDCTQDFFKRMAYNYDRGLDFDELPDGLLSRIVSQLEQLPPIFNEDKK